MDTSIETETVDLTVLAWDVPIANIQSARELWDSFLLQHTDLPSLITINPQQRRLLLHPRIQTEQALPTDAVDRCRSWGATLTNHTIESLSPITLDQLWTVLFFSGSRRSPPLQPGLPDTWRRVLSNFYPTNLVIEGIPYTSVEHFFQSQKALASSKPAMAQWFAANFTGPEAVDADAAAAKKAGSRKAYTKHGAVLDMGLWDARRVACMRLALQSRYNQDDLFRSILDSTQGMTLLHFERSGARSFWGGNISRQTGQAMGTNQLGRLMMELRNYGT